MKSSNKSNLGLSENEFSYLQRGEQQLQRSERRTYQLLAQQVVSEIEFALKPTLYQLTSNWNDAQDLLANTIEKFWQNLPHLEYRYLAAWVVTVCRNLYVSEYRKSSKIQLIDNWNESDLDFGQPAESERLLWDDKQKQESVIHDLFEYADDSRRSIIETVKEHYFERKSIKELAQKQGIDHNTLTQQKRRFFKDLRAIAETL